MRVRCRSVARRTFHSLGNRAYRRFWGSLMVLVAGVNMQMLVRGQLAWELTDDTFMVTLVGSAFALPILIFSIFGGAFADRWDRKKMIQYSQLAICFVAGLVGFAIYTEIISIWLFMVAGFAQGVCLAFMIPAPSGDHSAVGEQECDHERDRVERLWHSVDDACGFRARWFGVRVDRPRQYIFLDFGLMFAAFLMMIGLNVTAEPISKKRREENVLNAVWEGLRYSARNKTILILFILLLSTTMTTMSFRSLIPAQVDTVFGGGPSELGILMSTIGVAALLGTLFIAGLNENMPRGVILLAAAGLSALAILVSTFIGFFVVAAVAMMVFGLGNAGGRLLSAALLMEQADEEHRGRVMGIYALNFGLVLIGAYVLAMMTQATDFRVASAVAGCVLAASVILAWILTPRIRRL